jgi:hypothetical protein
MDNNQVNATNIEDVVAYTKALPDFPNKAIIVQRLETGNLNRYQEALMTLNEVLVSETTPNADACGTGVSREQLQKLADQIASLEAKDIVAE